MPPPPGPGQESVWDYPRPPRLEPVSKRIRVVVAGVTLADSTGAHRVLETSHPPVYYLPPADIQMEHLKQAAGTSFCEWKGRARYYDLRLKAADGGELFIPNIAWYYPRPTSPFAAIADCLAFYPSKADACYVDDEQVTAQEGDFYGGWITADIVGPFKGPPGTMGW